MPKFKAWDKESKTMDTVRRITWTNGDIADVYLENIGLRKLDEIILMQSTGVKDKSDVEIYEGDIIKDQYGDTKVIQWHKGAFVITDMVLDGHCRRFIYSHLDNQFNHHSKHEVLGNIYKNTGLLEIEVTE